MDQYLEFAGNNTLLVAALSISFFVLVFTELRRKSMGLTNVEPHDAVRLINADSVVIDIRSPEAFARGHIVNAKNIPIGELDANMEKVKKYKSILTVCDAGVSSNQAVNTLRKAGLDNVYGIRGGINAWTQANLPLVTAKKTGKKS
jgi:rhodanese-related sulfurtransferase